MQCFQSPMAVDACCVLDETIRPCILVSATDVHVMVSPKLLTKSRQKVKEYDTLSNGSL